MKKGSIILILLALFLPGLVLADTEISSTNSSTGADSTNTTSSTVTNDTSVTNSNTATTTNTIDIAGSTGGNSASGNSGDGAVDSGSINGEVGISNTDNQNTTTLADNGSVNILQQNTNTGADSTNSSGVDVTNTQTVINTNDSVKNNSLIADLTTGGNVADNNTGGGSVTSGDISFNIGVTNVDNINETVGGPAEGGGVSQPPEGPAGQQEGGPAVTQAGGGGVTQGGIAEQLAQGAPTEVTSAQPEGEVLGISSLPITGPKLNLWIASFTAAAAALAGWLMVKASYSWEAAIIGKKHRSRLRI